MTEERETVEDYAIPPSGEEDTAPMAVNEEAKDVGDANPTSFLVLVAYIEVCKGRYYQ